MLLIRVPVLNISGSISLAGGWLLISLRSASFIIPPLAFESPVNDYMILIMRVGPHEASQMAGDHGGGQGDFYRSAMSQDAHAHHHSGEAAQDHGYFHKIGSLHCIPSCCLA
jgi:hypothetical protein